MNQPLAKFLTALFGGAEAGWLNIFTLPNRHSQPYPAAKMHESYAYIAKQASAQNVYFTVGLLKAPPTRGRGDSALVSWLPALHADIDILHTAHKKQDLPPTMGDALSLLTPIPLPPSILLNSGHGLHAYWLFRELWYLDTEDERTQAYHLLCRLQATIREAARQQGWTLDSTFDMARVLRLPGTMNHNGGGVPVPVELMEIWPDRRYNPSDFSPYLVEVDALTNGNGGLVHLPDKLPDGIDANALTVSTHIKYLIIDGTDRLNPAKYPSRSEAVAAVIRALLSNDYDDPTIASLLLDPRYKISEKPIENGRKWVEGELQRLRSKPPPSLVHSRQGQDTPVPPSGQDEVPLPYIAITPDLSVVVDFAQQAILRMPGEPRLYQRARRLSVVARSAKSPKWLRRPEGTPVIITPAAAHVREIMSQAATWAKYDKRAKTWGNTLPPTWAVDTLINRTSWDFPPLEGIVCAPTIRPDGSLLRTPGYDADTGLYLALNGTTYPEIPEHPTIDEARTAIGRLQQGIFCDFPFTPARRGFSAALASLLSLVVRYAIDGPVPLFAVRSTIRGAGKGLLIDGIALTATGTVAPRWAQTTDDDEERKRLMSIALAGDVVSHIDNVVAPLGSGPLDSAITARVIADRTLGLLERQIVPLDTVFFASGNNMAFQGDMARRIIPIDLDPGTEHPEDRDDFKYPDLKKAVLQDRPTLVMAAVTIMRAFFEAECPKQEGVKPLGSFESWSNVIRQAVIWAGEEDPCDGRHEIEAESDPQYDTLKTLLTAWHGRYGKTPTTVKDLKADLDGHTTYDKDAGHEVVQPDWRDVHSAVLGLDRRGREINVHAIGNALRRWKGRMIDGQRFLSTPDTHTKNLAWYVESSDASK